MKLVLYHYWRSSSSWRVRFALQHKALAYESKFVNLLKSEQLGDAHKQVSPMGVVPCLLIDGRPLTESMAICEYLEEVVPERPLLPRDPWQRAYVRQIAEHINAGIQPLQNLIVLERVSPDPEPRKAWVKFFNERGLQALEAMLEGMEKAGISGRYAVGDELTLADVFLVPQVFTALRFEVSLEPFPRAARIYQTCMQLDAAIASSPSKQPDAPKPDERQ
ncbi:MAG TPA: maleylacetoacetate isomerase [Polyangiaceae bacterium]|nr:maleylacetoacetate isomerase [Polyangiaceae bacterium]